MVRKLWIYGIPTVCCVVSFLIYWYGPKPGDPIRYFAAPTALIAPVMILVRIRKMDLRAEFQGVSNRVGIVTTVAVFGITAGLAWLHKWNIHEMAGIPVFLLFVSMSLPFFLTMLTRGNQAALDKS